VSLRVIGIGSPFGDDAVGWRVIELLRGRLVSGVELLALDRPGPGLVTALEGVEHAVIIDAIRSGGSAGDLHRIAFEALAWAPDSPSSHGFGVAHALRLAAALGSLPPRLEIHTIELGELAGDGLSPEVETAAQTLAEQLADEFTTMPTPRCLTSAG